MSQTQLIPVAVIGCGTVAQYGHLPTIDVEPGLKLVAVADVNPATVAQTAEKYGAQGYDDYRALLKRDDIKAVTVATPLDLHYEVAAAALKAGKHVFCEKPFADTPRRCRHLVELAKKHNCLLAINFEYHFDEGIKRMRQLLESGALGELQVMRFINNWSAHGVEGEAGKRRARFLQHGGGAMDCGVHFLDLARFVSGSDFRSMSAMGQWSEPEFSGPGHILIQARMESGAMAFIESSFIYTHRSRDRVYFMQYEIIGDRGIASWCRPTGMPGSQFENNCDELHISTDEITEVQTFSAEKQFAKSYNEWAQCLSRGTLEGSDLASGHDGSEATIWMWRALAQAEREHASGTQKS